MNFGVELKGDIDKNDCLKRGDGKTGKYGYIKNKRRVVVSEYCPVAMSSLYCLVSLYLKKEAFENYCIFQCFPNHSEHK